MFPFLTVRFCARGPSGPSYGIQVTTSGVSNTGYAGYFNNASANGRSVYAPGASPSYFAGNVGIGNSGAATPGTNLVVEMTDSNGGISVQNDSSTTARKPNLTAYSYTGGFGGNSDVSFEVGRGSAASPAAVHNGDALAGLFGFGQYDTGGGDFGNAAYIYVDADANFSSSSYPANFIIYTTPSGSTTNTERIRVTSSGHLDYTGGGTPAISACGTSPPAATGNDNVFQLTTGTAAPTSCTATFNIAWANAPICATQEFNGTVVTYVSAASTTAITVTFASGLTSQKVNVLCTGWE